MVGTAPYMSPEQARGQTVDRRTDIWAFGCVLYEMLAGSAVFGGHTATDTIAAVLDRDPDWSRLPPTVPESIHALLRRCLEKDPAERLHDIADAKLLIADAARTGAATVAMRSRSAVADASNRACERCGTCDGPLGVDRWSTSASSIGLLELTTPLSEVTPGYGLDSLARRQTDGDGGAGSEPRADLAAVA